MTDLSNVQHALSILDADTRAMVVAVFGREPEADLEPSEAERLAAVIAAVNAGRQAQADADAAAGMHVAPETAAEKAAPELPELPPPDVEPLRARIRAMDDTTRGVFLERWTASNLGPLADGQGNGLLLPLETYHAIEQLVADHEPPAPDHWHPQLIARWQDMGPGPRHVAESRYKMQTARDLRNALELTVGRASTFAQIIDAVEAEADEVVTAALGPVAEPVGQVITSPVADAEELTNALPPKAKVAEVLAWVGADLARARFALNAEMARNKPRDGVVSKLAPLVGGAAEPLPPGSAPPPAADPSGEVTAPADPPAAVAPPSPEPLAGVQTSIEDALEAYGDVPPEKWGPLTTVAFLRRLSNYLDKAARIIEEGAQS